MTDNEMLHFLRCAKYALSNTSIDAYKTAISYATRFIANHMWHEDVQDCPPETDDRVLVCTVNKAGHKNVLIGYYMNGTWHCGMNNNVIAWMPLPDVPEEQEQ